jgi:hypothetical protein
VARAATSRKPFICDVPAKMLKRCKELSKGARMLHGTMRGLANGKTGELAIRGNPLDWKFIAREAEIGRDQWQRLLRELLAAGYVTRERERVEHYASGRKRIVLGRARYFVHKQPKHIKKTSILLMPDSPTVEESGTQVFQKHLEPSPRGVGGRSSSVSFLEPQGTESSSPTEKPDDDPLILLRAKAEETLCKKYHLQMVGIECYPEMVSISLDHIMERIVEHGQPIGSPNYIVKAFENLWGSREYNEVFDEFQNRKRLREKYMPNFTGPTPETEEHRRAFVRAMSGAENSDADSESTVLASTALENKSVTRVLATCVNGQSAKVPR